jgi:hypothetical protein
MARHDALRVVIDMVPDDESAQAAKARTERTTWLEQRDYRIFAVPVAQIEGDLAGVLDRLAAEVDAAGSPSKTS